jgi:transcriptional regulator with XRE-family HTH domain
MTEGSPGGVIGRNVRAVREAQLLSRAELAERSGVSVPGIDHLERGITSRPRRRTIEKLAQALDVPVEHLMSEEPISPKVSAPPSQQLTLNGFFEEERRLRYLRVLRLFAAAMNEQWTGRVERGDFSEEAFEHAVYLFRDLDASYVRGIGPDLLGALRTQELTLPEAEREAFDDVKASIDAWHRTMWRAYDVLRARGNVARLDDYRTSLEALPRAAGE